MPEIFAAGLLEDRQVCPRCQTPIRVGDQVARCPHCRHIQHEACWRDAGACRSYECLAATGTRNPPDLVITREDVARVAVPAPAFGQVPVARVVGPQAPANARTSGLAIAAFVASLVGVVAMGVPGLIGIILGSIAIGGINVRRQSVKGTPFAAAAIIIGVLSLVGWTAAGALYFIHRPPRDGGEVVIPPVARPFDAKNIADAPPAVQRAFRANVLIVASGAGTTSEGSGIIIAAQGGRFHVLTNRHVIDGGGRLNAPGIRVTFSDGAQTAAEVAWRGPAGLDAAVLTCTHVAGDARPAAVRLAPTLHVGEPVFAVGNPFGLGWSYSQGVISAMRTQPFSEGTVGMIQAQLPLNPGNSGGGLYDQAGALIGVNTLSTDKRTSESIGFAIAIADLVPLIEQDAGVTFAKAPEDRSSTTRPAP